MDNDTKFMQAAMALAIKAETMAEVPIGAIVVKDNQIIGEGWNQPIDRCDPTAHAEIIALRAAAKQLGNYRLINCTMYVTLEPCLMCTGAIIHSRIERLVFGAFDPKLGATSNISNLFTTRHINHHVQVQGGILQEECSSLLTEFFQKRRLNTVD